MVKYIVDTNVFLRFLLKDNEEYFKKGDCIITNKSEDSSDCSVPMHIIRRFQHFVDIKDLLITKGNNK